jgi:hypothetical protein
MKKDAIDLGKFEPMSKQKLEECLRKGRENAEELDRAIRSSFEMRPEDTNLRLR